jgi:hypothetical protein
MEDEQDYDYDYDEVEEKVVVDNGFTNFVRPKNEVKEVKVLPKKRNVNPILNIDIED